MMELRDTALKFTKFSLGMLLRQSDGFLAGGFTPIVYVPVERWLNVCGGKFLSK